MNRPLCMSTLSLMHKEDSAVLIVGASGGIGGALYRLFSPTRRVFGISSQVKNLPDWFATDYSSSSMAEIADKIHCRFSKIFICNGFLHGDGYFPEKRLIDVESTSMHAAYERNVVIPAMALRLFRSHIEQIRPAHCAVLSARVGSIGDNRAGGWYSYRCAKAALNMFVKTTAIELKRTNKKLVLVAVHPGTTQTGLSEPFLKRSARQRVSADQTALRIEHVVSHLDVSSTGGFYDWQGDIVEW